MQARPVRGRHNEKASRARAQTDCTNLTAASGGTGPGKSASAALERARGASARFDGIGNPLPRQRQPTLGWSRPTLGRFEHARAGFDQIWAGPARCDESWPCFRQPRHLGSCWPTSEVGPTRPELVLCGPKFSRIQQTLAGVDQMPDGVDQSWPMSVDFAPHLGVEFGRDRNGFSAMSTGVGLPSAPRLARSLPMRRCAGFVPERVLAPM